MKKKKKSRKSIITKKVTSASKILLYIAGVLVAILFVALKTGIFSHLRVLGLTSAYYVDKDSVGGKCSDTNSGTISAPFCTFAKAHAVAVAGDTIYFRRGTYPGMIITKSGTSTAYLTFASYPGEKVVVDGTGMEATIYLKQTRYVEVNGFEVIHASTAWFSGIHARGLNVAGTDYGITLSSNNRIINNVVHDNVNGTNEIEGIQTINSSYNLIQGNTVYNNYYSGIGVEAQPNVPVIGNQIINNVVYGNLGVPNNEGNADGIHTGGNRSTKNIILGNISYGNGDDGIDTWDSSNNTIERNISHDNRGSGDGNGFKMGGGRTAGSGGNNVVFYNISYNNKGDGFQTNGSGGDIFYNNVSFNNSGFGFEDGWRTTGSTGIAIFKNNIGMNNVLSNFSAGPYTSASDYNIWYGTTATTSRLSYNYSTYTSITAFSAASGKNFDIHSRSSNPLFVNSAAFIFQLQTASPAINSGTNVGLIADFAGSIVPQGTAVDMGAYEYGTTVIVTPTPTTTASPAPTASALPTATPKPSATPIPTPTPTATPVTSPTPTPTSPPKAHGKKG